MAAAAGPKATSAQLLLGVDALNPKSYPGSGTNWQDLSNNTPGMNLLNSPTFTGSTFVFSTNQHADLGSSAANIVWSPSVARTVEIWFRFISYPTTSNGNTIWGDQSGTTGTMVTFAISSGQEGKIAWRWDDSQQLASQKTMALGEWAQVVILLEGYDATYYINGALDTPRFTSTDLAVAGNTRWSIAKDNRRGTFLNIEAGVARQYSRVLTSEDISNNFNALRGRYGI